jgi:hypothetical protein
MAESQAALALSAVSRRSTMMSLSQWTNQEWQPRRRRHDVRILNMSLSPAINGEPTSHQSSVLRICTRAVRPGHVISQWLTPHQLSVVHRRAVVRVPMDLEEGALLRRQPISRPEKEAAVLIPLSALVF